MVRIIYDCNLIQCWASEPEFHLSSRQDLIRNSLGTCLGGALLDSLVVSAAPQKAARSGRKYGDVRSARTFAGAVEQWLGRR